jgi:peptide/nickel transport system permease protein
MKLRRTALCFVLTIATLSLGADLLAPNDYARQFRDAPRAAPSWRFPLGTDELGRDRLSRLIHGTRVSLLCAGGAALVATALGGVFGLLAGYSGAAVVMNATTDLVLSLPWLFLLLTVRALFPLNASPWSSVIVTFLMLAGTGWAPGARVVQASVADLRVSGMILHARACGCSRFRLLSIHILPNLKPVLVAQFWTLLPVFVLAEANLGILGLGFAEPVPSWGNILSELRNYQAIYEAPWLLAPAALLVLVIASLHLVLSDGQTCAK